MTDNFDKQYDTYFDSKGAQQIETDTTEAIRIDEPTTENEGENVTASDDGVNVADTASRDDEGTKDSISATDGDNEATTEAQEDKTSEIANNLKAALKEERGKRQEVDRQVKELQQQNQQIQEALQSLLHPKQQEHIPNYEEDPVAYLKWQQEKIAQGQQQQTQYLQQQYQQQQTYNEAINLNNDYLQQKTEYTKSNPDFDNAAQFLEQSVLNEYKALGYSEADSQQLLVQDKMALLSNAKQKQLSSPELILQLAQARGYKPNNAQQESKLVNVKNGMQKSKSLGTTGGQSTNKNVSLEDLSKMNDKEFAKVFSQYAKGDLQVS